MAWERQILLTAADPEVLCPLCPELLVSSFSLRLLPWLLWSLAHTRGSLRRPALQSWRYHKQYQRIYLYTGWGLAHDGQVPCRSQPCLEFWGVAYTSEVPAGSGWSDPLGNCAWNPLLTWLLLSGPASAIPGWLPLEALPRWIVCTRVLFISGSALRELNSEPFYNGSSILQNSEMWFHINIKTCSWPQKLSQVSWDVESHICR